MAFASIERNWLIFHPQLVRSKRGRILFHYCPLAFCVIYPPMFFTGAIFICRCKVRYFYTVLLCLWPCYIYEPTWANIDLFFNNYTPLIAIPVFCIIIYLRVLFQKRSMKQQVFKWRRDRKMILQLWAISSLYLGMWMPLELSGLINYFWNPRFLVQEQIDYMYLFPDLIHLIYPFVVLFIFRHDMLNFNRRNAVHAINA